MHHSQHFDLVWLDAIDDPIGPLEHFAQRVDLVFRHPAARMRQLANALGVAGDPIDHRVGTQWRFLGNMGTNGAELGYRLIGEADSHSGKPNSRRTAFTSVR